MEGKKLNIVSYSNITTTRNGYKNQLIYYYNIGIGKVSEIAGVKITKRLISTIEKRYVELGGKLPIQQSDIDEKKGVRWTQI